MSDPPNPIATPPSTTLSTPSPTELHDIDPLSASNMLPSTPSSSSARALKHIYLIVATTPVTTPAGPRLGIGLKGSLPWPMIKPDMNYFRKVTTEGSERNSSSLSDATKRTINSVIMGRKTYESIPPKFRPLSNRHNHIITRSDLMSLSERYRDELVARDTKTSTKQNTKSSTNASEPMETHTQPSYNIIKTNTFPPDSESIVTISPSQTDSSTPPITMTHSLSAALASSSLPSSSPSPSPNKPPEPDLLICIGGAEIYNLFLADSTLRPRLRILQTEIRKLKEGEEFECDTFWPGDLKGDEWGEVSTEEVVKWTGVEVPQESEEWRVIEGEGVKIRVRGWVARHAS